LPEYAALSYVWGEQDNPARIYLDGEAFHVTRNLYSSLRRLREGYDPLILWVDAICVDQSNTAERELQIILMRRIFQQAQGVFADVGEEAEPEKLLVPLLKAIVKAGKTYSALKNESKRSSSICSDGIRSGQTMMKIEQDSLDSETAMAAEPTHPRLEHYGSPSWGPPTWDSCRHFFASPYFHRVWILQEFVLSKRLMFLYGDLRVPPNLLLDFLHYTTRYGNNTSTTYLGHFNDDDEVRRLATSGIGGWVNFEICICKSKL